MLILQKGFLCSSSWEILHAVAYCQRSTAWTALFRLSRTPADNCLTFCSLGSDVDGGHRHHSASYTSQIFLFHLSFSTKSFHILETVLPTSFYSCPLAFVSGEHTVGEAGTQATGSEVSGVICSSPPLSCASEDGRGCGFSRGASHRARPLLPPKSFLVYRFFSQKEATLS